MPKKSTFTSRIMDGKIGPQTDYKKSEHTKAREKLEIEIGHEIKLLIKALRIFLEKNSKRTII